MRFSKDVIKRCQCISETHTSAFPESFSNKSAITNATHTQNAKKNSVDLKLTIPNNKLKQYNYATGTKHGKANKKKMALSGLHMGADLESVCFSG